MKTPSLRRRVTVASLLALLTISTATGLIVYLGLRNALHGALDETLQERAELAVELADSMPAEAVAERLAGLGVLAEIRTSDGETVTAEPVAPRVTRAFPSPVQTSPSAVRSTTVRSSGGDVITVSVFTGGVDRALRRLLLLEIGVGVAALAVAAFTFDRVSRAALAPLDHVVATAEQVGGGDHSARLRPADPTTELGRAVSAIDGMLDSVEDAIHRANDADARSKQFLADAAHQLRTPLTGVTAIAETLLRDPNSPRREELLYHLGTEATRAGRLTDDLLLMARLDRGVPLRPEPCDLAALCRDEAERISALAPSLDVRAGGEDELVARVDRHGICDAISNLLDNAKRHARTSIDLTVDRAGDDAVIRVANDGPTMTPDDADHAFRRFSSLDARGGSGLGLPIARRYVQAMGGELVYEDGVFVIRLLAAAEAEEGVAASVAPRRT